MSFLRFWVLVWVVFGIGGCASDPRKAGLRTYQEAKDWSDAQTADTEAAYKAYVTKYEHMFWRRRDTPLDPADESHVAYAQVRLIWLSAARSNTVTRAAYESAKEYFLDSYHWRKLNGTNTEPWKSAIIPYRQAMVTNIVACGSGAVGPLLRSWAIPGGVNDDENELGTALVAAWKKESTKSTLDTIVTFVRLEQHVSYWTSDAFVAVAAKLGAPAQEVLLEFLGQRDPFWRYQAARALTQIHRAPDAEFVKAEDVLLQLVSARGDISKLAADELIRIKSKKADAIFAHALEEGDLQLIAIGINWFILKGIRGSEGKIEQSLERYGDSTMLTAMLNSGNERLQATARSWVETHHYRVMTFYSNTPGHARWGSGNH